MTPAELAASLRTVPETRLALIDLARELVNGQGELDEDAAIQRMDEIRLAAREASDYAHGAQRLFQALQQCLRPR